MSSLQQKIKGHAEKQESMTHSRWKKEANRNCHWRDTGLTRQWLYINRLKCAQRNKENHRLRTTGNQKNNVWTKGHYQ